VRDLDSAPVYRRAPSLGGANNITIRLSGSKETHALCVRAPEIYDGLLRGEKGPSSCMRKSRSESMTLSAIA
jgi:hypothetical protein